MTKTKANVKSVEADAQNSQDVVVKQVFKTVRKRIKYFRQFSKAKEPV